MKTCAKAYLHQLSNWLGCIEALAGSEGQVLVPVPSRQVRFVPGSTEDIRGWWEGISEEACFGEGRVEQESD